MTAGAVSHAQPSVIKVGGVTEYLKVAALADELGVRLAPHSPYFGPGLLATLQLMSLRDDGTFVEVFYMKRAACLWRGRQSLSMPAAASRCRRTGWATSRTRKSWSATASPERLTDAPVILRRLSLPAHPLLLRILSRLFVRRLQIVHGLLQGNDRALQGRRSGGWRRRASAAGRH